MSIASLVEILVFKKNNVNCRVSENGDIATLKAFIDYGVSPKPHCIVISAFGGRLPFLIHCVENLEININSVDLYGRTAIHRACEAKRGLIVK